MFDFSWSELFIVVVVAVVVVGPKDLPRMMRVVGQWAGKARAMADQFKRSFEDMARQAELEEMRAEVMKTYNDKTLQEMQRETDVMLGYLPPDGAESHTIAPPGLTAAPPPEFTGDAPAAPIAPTEPATAEPAPVATESAPATVEHLPAPEPNKEA